MRDALKQAHRATFGGGDVEEVVATAVKEHVPPPETERPHISRGAETRTSGPESARVPTERLSTSAAIARDRDSIRARPVSWAIVAGAIGAAALSVTVWLKVHPVKSRAVDAGSSSVLAAMGSDATAVTAMHTEAPPPRTEATAVAAPQPLASAAPPLVPPTTPPTRHPVPPSPPPPRDTRPHRTRALRRRAAVHRGSSDSAGHKQYKPECF